MGHDDEPTEAVTHLFEVMRSGAATPIQAEALATLVVAVRSAAIPGRVATPPRTRNRMLATLLTTKAAVLAGTLVFGATGAAAATGTMPDVVQKPTHSVLTKVGLDVPKRGLGHSKAKRADGVKPGKSGTAGQGLCTAAIASAGSPAPGSAVAGVDPATCGTEKPGKPADKGKPADEGKPGDKGKPDGKGKPADAGKPTEPGEPSGPGKPAEPGQPAAPTDGGRPTKPGAPTTAAPTTTTPAATTTTTTKASTTTTTSPTTTPTTSGT